MQKTQSVDVSLTLMTVLLVGGIVALMLALL
jgi:hypothetical protein